MTAKETWKIYHRMIRIAHREARKATMDMLIYGTGVVSITKEGEAKHVPLPDIKSLEKILGDQNGSR